jgi:hypothetical protein
MRFTMWTLLMSLILSSGIARAGIIPVGFEVTEVMMEVADGEVTFINTLFGQAAPPLLQWITTTDPGIRGFSFTLTSSPLTDLVAGALNATTGAYEWTSTGAGGGTAWTGDGTLAIEDPSGTSNVTSTQRWEDADGNLFSQTRVAISSGTTDDQGNWLTASSTSITQTFKNGKKTSTLTAMDNYDGKNWQFGATTEAEGGPPISDLKGFALVAGGVGTFDSQVVPEPSTFNIFAAIITGLLGRYGCHRRSAIGRLLAKRWRSLAFNSPV